MDETDGGRLTADSRSQNERRRRRVITRAAPLAAIAVVAFVIGIIVGGGPDAPEAQRFVDAWEQGDYAAMYAELSPDSQSQVTAEQFQQAYETAAATATLDSISAGEISDQNDVASTMVAVSTHAFGNLNGRLELPLSDGMVVWTPNLVYPGLAANEHLIRRTRAPSRAAILASDGTPLSSGPASARSVGTAASAIAGIVGTPTDDQAAELTRQGFPPGTLTGTSGLELAFNDRLDGKPGGQLVAVGPGDENSIGGGRILAQTDPVRGKAVRTNIVPELQQTAVEALGSLYGGAAVLDARTGGVMALSGIAFSAPQPPGSTFKIITATGALDAGIVKTSDTFPVESSNSDIGREIANAHDELCGGTFVESFANSCNTVFAPLGAELGGEKLVETAKKFGFNSRPELFDPQAMDAIRPPASTIPEDLTDSVATGESAIGQGEVLATPLEMASVAQTIANEGVRLPTPIARGPDLAPDAEPVKVTSPETAAIMRQMMIEVVNNGTGVAGALTGIQVAGKTGTAEIGPKALEPGQELEPGEDPPLETDAWFTAFAPASKPKIVVAVMVVNSDGDGGTIAAPIVRQIMATYFGVA
jgi:peptidoglycan glycosyltransferase